MFIYFVIGWILWQLSAPAWVWAVFATAAVIYLICKGITISDRAKK